jgi:hypothetical protein
MSEPLRTILVMTSCPPPRPVAAPPPSRRYGLDIETDTTVDGLDATCAAIVAVAVSSTAGDRVYTGDEAQILRSVDALFAALEPGVIVTWNGTFFDLPFLAARAALHQVPLGLCLDGDSCTEWPPPHRPGPHGCSWWRHRHLDGYRLYRDDLGRSLGLSCGLKSLSRLAGLTPLEVDRSQIHLLDEAQVRAYVASDARLAREMVDRRMPLAYASVDPPSDRAVVPGAHPSSSSLPTITLD